jgi:hypothetical protein
MDRVCSNHPQSNAEVTNEMQGHRASENIWRTAQNLFLRISHIVDVDDGDIENAVK